LTERRYAVVAGGGTAGHVVPALAVARALADSGHDRTAIEMVASTRGNEGSLLAGEGFGVTLLPGRGLSRRLHPRDLARNAGAVASVGLATWRAVVAFGRWRPAVAVAVGGYASFPAGVAAVVRRVPLVVVNVDAVPGLVNRILGRFAAACAVGFPGTPLPRAVTTGTPVRADIATVDRSPSARLEARRALGLPIDRPVVAVFGGSLGARRLNITAVELARRWAGRSDRALYHVTGRRDWDHVESLAGTQPVAGDTGEADGPPTVRRVPFEERMPLLYSAADVVVCRAGAMTVAELAVAGVPAVLVPLPGAPGDHQTANARALVEVDAAVLVPDDECDAGRIDELLDRLLGDPTSLDRMGEAAKSLGHADAAARVAEVVEDRAR
jgi:undecaprenyldiphospho-muramoylpentapeptide beta-N-acetylglucosaminyltransferase